jgi:hypothetical protein
MAAEDRDCVLVGELIRHDVMVLLQFGDPRRSVLLARMAAMTMSRIEQWWWSFIDGDGGDVGGPRR